MLIFVARYAFIFWVSIFSSTDQNLIRNMEQEQPNFYPISACTAKCMQIHRQQLQQQQQQTYQQQQESPLLFQNCFDVCDAKNKTSNQLAEGVRKIHENFVLKLICRDDRSLTFRIDMEGNTAATAPYQALSFNVNAGSQNKHAINASAKWTEGETITPSSSEKSQNVYVVTIHVAKDAQEYLVYLSDENFFVIDDLKQNTTYNITSVAVNANYEYSVIAKGQQYTTLRRGYTPALVQDIQVKNFQVDENNDERLTAKITWKPSADMTCHYNIICFSEREDGLTPVEIRNSRQLYSYNIENLAFSSVYKIGIRAVNPNNSSKESDLFWKTFQAPSCVEWYNYNFNICAPPEPEGLEIEAFVESEDEFSFNISWQQPEHYPDYYTLRILDLSLENGNSYIMNVSKLHNTILVSKIKLHGIMYEVHLTAYTPGGHSTAVVHDQIRALLSVPENPHVAKLIAAVLAPIFCLAILSLTTFIICHRRAKLKRYQERCKYFEELEKKAPIDPKANFDFPTKNLPPLLTAPEQFQLEMFFYNDAMEIDRNDLTLHEVLGEGAFGLVRRGLYQDNKLGTREVAVKMLKDNPSADDVRAFRREIEVMKSVEKHPNIVGIIGHCTKLCNEMLLLTEYCSFGNLLNFLRNEWKYLHELNFQVDGTITMLPHQHQQPPQQQQQQQQLYQQQQHDTSSNNNKQNVKSNSSQNNSSNSNNNPFTLDATIIKKIKQKYKYLHTTTNTSSTTTQDTTLCCKKNQQQETLLSGSNNKVITTILTGKEMQHIEEISNTTTTTVDTPPHPRDIAASAAAAENKSYGYDKICTNACKCQVDVLVIKDIDPTLPQSETEQLERALHGKNLNTTQTRMSKIKIRNCDCSKVLAKNNKNNAKLRGSSRSVVNKGYYKYLTAKGDDAAIKKRQSIKCNKKNSESKTDDYSNGCDNLRNSCAADPANAVATQDENEKLIGSVKREPLTTLDLLDIAKQVAIGMEFLAKNKVVHRDLAARNVLVSPDRTIKIADFGLSRDIYQENIYKKTGNGKLPIKWLALESMTHQVYTTQSDVWSYGILLYEIVTLGSIPYPSIPTNRLVDLLKTGYRMEKPKNCEQEFYNLMHSCWNVNPAERPNFTQIIRNLDELMLDTSQRQCENLVLPKAERPEEAANSDDAYLNPLW